MIVASKLQSLMGTARNISAQRRRLRLPARNPGHGEMLYTHLAPKILLVKCENAEKLSGQLHPPENEELLYIADAEHLRCDWGWLDNLCCHDS